MKRMAMVIVGATLVLAGQPAAAQTQRQEKAQPQSGAQNSSAVSEKEDAFMARLARLYPVEPLTAKQQARLPEARAVIDKMLPPGAMQKVMDSMFNRILRPLMQSEFDDPRADIARRLGMSKDKLALDPQQTREVATIIDPAWKDRSEALSSVISQTMRQVMAKLEPSMRKAMSEIYAVHFDSKQLADLDTFFSTPTGVAYATEMMTISSDPRMMGMMMRDMPTMMGSFKDIGQRMTAATADLPKPRTYAQLTEAQRDKLAGLTGLSQAELKARLGADSPATGSHPK